MSTMRILLQGSDGRTSYLVERVSKQSLGDAEIRVLKKPPWSMFPNIFFIQIKISKVELRVSMLVNSLSMMIMTTNISKISF